MDVSSESVAAPAGEHWTEAGLCRWVGQAKPGEILVYHRGFLAVDASDPGASERQRQDLLRVASRARSLAAQGVVHLLQRRHGPNDFAYLLVVRSHPANRGCGGTPARQRLAATSPMKPVVAAAPA